MSAIVWPAPASPRPTVEYASESNSKAVYSEGRALAGLAESRQIAKPRPAPPRFDHAVRLCAPSDSAKSPNRGDSSLDFVTNHDSTATNSECIVTFL